MVVALLILVVMGAAAFGVWHHISVGDKEAMLRLDPPPVSWMTCKLPTGFDDSEQKMINFYSKLTDICQTDKEGREQGLGVIHVAWCAEKTGDARVPEVVFLIGCHPEVADAVKTRLQSAYGLDLNLQSLQENPLAAEVGKVRAAVPVKRPLEGPRRALHERLQQRKKPSDGGEGLPG